MPTGKNKHRLMRQPVSSSTPNAHAADGLCKKAGGVLKNRGTGIVRQKAILPLRPLSEKAMLLLPNFYPDCSFYSFAAENSCRSCAKDADAEE